MVYLQRSIVQGPSDSLGGGWRSLIKPALSRGKEKPLEQMKDILSFGELTIVMWVIKPIREDSKYSHFPTMELGGGKERESRHGRYVGIIHWSCYRSEDHKELTIAVYNERIIKLARGVKGEKIGKKRGNQSIFILQREKSLFDQSGKKYYFIVRQKMTGIVDEGLLEGDLAETPKWGKRKNRLYGKSLM